MLRVSECSDFSRISIIFKGKILARLLAGYQKSSKRGQIKGDITRPNAFMSKGLAAVLPNPEQTQSTIVLIFKPFVKATIQAAGL